MGTYVPSRWANLAELAQASRNWLEQLPRNVAAQIAYGNAASRFDPRVDN
jgi:hypothetical protein